MKEVSIYTDGACSGNPGKGGWGAILLYGDKRKEISGGYLLTTNNRMELRAVIFALKALKEECKVTLFTDSQYIVNAVTKGWAIRWQKNNWMRNKSDAAENPDLWKELLALLQHHQVEFRWVRGHAGNPLNERADALAVAASQMPSLPPDVGFRG
jgi:ribonuclease HI